MKASLLLATLASAILITGCSRQGSYRLLGADVVSVSATDRVVSQAMRAAADVLAARTINADGSTSFPTFHASGRQWAAGKESKEPDLSRSLVEFDDPQGKHHTIESVQEKGKPAFVFIHSTPAANDAALPVLNAFVKCLEQQRVTSAH